MKIIFVVSLSILLIGSGYVVYGRFFEANSEEKLSNKYKYKEKMTIVEPGGTTCAAEHPSCGYCPGEVYNGYCYYD